LSPSGIQPAEIASIALTQTGTQASAAHTSGNHDSSVAILASSPLSARRT
jgi:hypothetical protein